MSQLETRPCAQVYTYVHEIARKTESENRGKTFQAMILILKRAPISLQRSAACDVKYSARARRASAEIRVTRKVPIYFVVFIYLAKDETQLPDPSSLLYSLPAVSSREVCHDISKGELPTGMSDRVHFADFSCKHEALGAAKQDRKIT